MNLSVFFPNCIDAFRKTIAAFGGLDIAVNNAGVFNDRFWEFEVDVNLVSGEVYEYTQYMFLVF